MTKIVTYKYINQNHSNKIKPGYTGEFTDTNTKCLNKNECVTKLQISPGSLDALENNRLVKIDQLNFVTNINLTVTRVDRIVYVTYPNRGIGTLLFVGNIILEYDNKTYSGILPFILTGENTYQIDYAFLNEHPNLFSQYSTTDIDAEFAQSQHYTIYIKNENTLFCYKLWDAFTEQYYKTKIDTNLNRNAEFIKRMYYVELYNDSPDTLTNYKYLIILGEGYTNNDGFIGTYRSTSILIYKIDGLNYHNLIFHKSIMDNNKFNITNNTYSDSQYDDNTSSVITNNFSKPYQFGMGFMNRKTEYFSQYPDEHTYEFYNFYLENTVKTNVNYGRISQLLIPYYQGLDLYEKFGENATVDNLINTFTFKNENNNKTYILLLFNKTLTNNFNNIQNYPIGSHIYKNSLLVIEKNNNTFTLVDIKHTINNKDIVDFQFNDNHLFFILSSNAGTITSKSVNLNYYLYVTNNKTDFSWLTYLNQTSGEYYLQTINPNNFGIITFDVTKCHSFGSNQWDYGFCILLKLYDTNTKIIPHKII